MNLLLKTNLFQVKKKDIVTPQSYGYIALNLFSIHYTNDSK